MTSWSCRFNVHIVRLVLNLAPAKNSQLSMLIFPIHSVGRLRKARTSVALCALTSALCKFALPATSLYVSWWSYIAPVFSLMNSNVVFICDFDPLIFFIFSPSLFRHLIISLCSTLPSPLQAALSLSSSTVTAATTAARTSQ